MSFLATNLKIALFALVVEGAFGYPKWLQRAVAHPVVWIGAIIGRLDRAANRDEAAPPARRAAGALALAAILAGVLAVTEAVHGTLFAFLPWPFAVIAEALLASSLLARHSLNEHVAKVAEALEAGGLQAGREAVSHIVGRNPAQLDETGVARAAIESLAENFSDAVVAPAFWCALCGLPGIALYKTINTADSMLGHRTPRHQSFGWAAARLDDLVNLPASRLAAVFVVIAALRDRLHPAAAARAVWRDASRHRSPNAGWPEAAMAGALGLRLAGPRFYGETAVQVAWMGDGRDPAPADIGRALALYGTACGLQIAGVAAAAGLLAFIARG